MQAEFCFPQGFSFPFGISGKSEIVLVGFFFFSKLFWLLPSACFQSHVVVVVGVR